MGRSDPLAEKHHGTAEKEDTKPDQDEQFALQIADGRAFDELRPLKIEAGVLERADGSAYVEIGDNKVLAAVYGPRELHVRRLLKPNMAILRCRYNMAPFSVEDRKRPGPDRRSVEISKIAFI